MAVPNLVHIVHQIRNSQPWDFTTKEGLCQYSNTVITELHKIDSGFGHLLKDENQTHCIDSLNRRHAVDVTLYKPTGQVVDFIESAGFGIPPPSNNVTWGEGPLNEYGPEKWFAPVSDGTTPIPPNDLEQRVTLIETVHIPGLQSQITELAKQIADLHQLFVTKPLPEYEGRAPLFGGTVISRPRT